MKLPNYPIDDEEFSKLFPEEIFSEDDVISNMIDQGWSLGMTPEGENIFWPPEIEERQQT